jgi:DNA-binding transcriptional LysR family regulator
MSQAMGVGWVNATTQWRCPAGVTILPVPDLNIPLPLALVWRKDNISPLLARFVEDIRSLANVKAIAKK